MSDTFCSSPWVNLHLHPSGWYRPCCIYKGNITHAKDGAKSAYTHEIMQKLRQQFLNGDKPAGCRGCFDKEEAGAKSVRQDFNEAFPRSEIDFSLQAKHKDVKRMDISFSNVCNMACRFCGPYCSTKWIDDAKELPNEVDNFWSLYKSNHWRPYTTDIHQLIDNLQEFENIEELEIKGGEPFISKDHLKFLELLIDCGKAKYLQLYYTTNGSFISDEYLNLLSQFKSVNISISIDAVGELYQYIRNTKITTDQLLVNIQKMSTLANAELGVHYTLSAYNIFELSSFFEWYSRTLTLYCSSLSWGVVTGPEHLDVRFLPSNIRQTAAAKIEQHTHPFMTEIYDALTEHHEPNKNADFPRYVRELDRIKKTEFIKLVPEFKSYFSK